MTDTGGELTMNHSLTSFGSDIHHTTYQTIPIEPSVQNNGDSFTEEKHVSASADGQDVGLADQQQFVGMHRSVAELSEPGPGSEMVSQETEEPTIDIVINNVVSSFSTRCHLDLKRIAQHGCNVMYRRENGMVSMKLRRPYTTASIWSSGKITCTGARSEEEAKIAARKFARVIQNLGYRVRFCNFRVVNVLGTCSFPFGIRITHFSRDHKESASYEPELHPGVTYKIPHPDKATLKIFSTGSITVTAPCVRNVQLAIEHIFPLVYAYKMDRAEKIKGPQQRDGPMHLMPKSRKPLAGLPLARHKSGNSDDDMYCSSDEEDEEDEDEFDSEESQD